MLLKIPDALTLETPEQVRALRDLLDCYLRLSAPTMPAQAPFVPALPLAPIAPETSVETPSERPEEKKAAGKQPTMAPLYRKAFVALGGRGSVEEAYQKFRELGFVSTAKNPKDAINTHLRHRDDWYLRLAPDEQGVTRWQLKGG